AQEGECLPAAHLVNIHLFRTAVEQMIRQPERVQPYSLRSPRLGLDLLVAWCPAVPPVLAQVGSHANPHPASGRVVSAHVLPFHLHRPPYRTLPRLIHPPPWPRAQAFSRQVSGVFAWRDTVFSPMARRSREPMIGMAGREPGAG